MGVMRHPKKKTRHIYNEKKLNLNNSESTRKMKDEKIQL